jgi:hypothetical protein
MPADKYKDEIDDDEFTRQLEEKLKQKASETTYHKLPGWKGRRPNPWKEQD